MRAALEVLGTTSLDHLSTRQVARRCEISQPALFRHFPSREALLVAVVAHARVELGRRAAPVLASDGAAVVRLVAVARMLAEFVVAHPGLPTLLFADAARMGDPGNPLRLALAHLVSMQRALIAQLVSEAQGEGTLRADVSPEDAAALLVGLVQGLVRQWQLDPGALDLPLQAARLSQLWIEGVGARGEQPRADRASAQACGAPALRRLDLRPILAGGRDPLSDVMRELAGCAPGSLMHLVAPFRPAPLIGLLEAKGHALSVEAAPGGVWSVVVVVGGSPPLVDLRDRPAPEPLEHTLEALAALPAGGLFLAHLPRLPRLLLPHLDRLGIRWGVEALPGGSALLHAARPEGHP